MSKTTATTARSKTLTVMRLSSAALFTMSGVTGTPLFAFNNHKRLNSRSSRSGTRYGSREHEIPRPMTTSPLSTTTTKAMGKVLMSSSDQDENINIQSDEVKRLMESASKLRAEAEAAKIALESAKSSSSRGAPGREGTGENNAMRNVDYFDVNDSYWEIT